MLKGYDLPSRGCSRRCFKQQAATDSSNYNLIEASFQIDACDWSIFNPIRSERNRASDLLKPHLRSPRRDENRKQTEFEVNQRNQNATSGTNVLELDFRLFSRDNDIFR